MAEGEERKALQSKDVFQVSKYEEGSSDSGKIFN